VALVGVVGGGAVVAEHGSERHVGGVELGLHVVLVVAEPHAERLVARARPHGAVARLAGVGDVRRRSPARAAGS
jgi:hypothetical protein